MPKHASVTEAHALQQKGGTYVDVRSRAEFEAGHAAGALNVPLLDRDDQTGQVMPNPDFVRVMKALFPPETQLLIGCQVGGRSMRASQMLESFGFSDVTNIKADSAACAIRWAAPSIRAGKKAGFRSKTAHRPDAGMKIWPRRPA
jgi:rhodanese-related sulfurtransferase